MFVFFEQDLDAEKWVTAQTAFISASHQSPRSSAGRCTELFQSLVRTCTSEMLSCIAFFFFFLLSSPRNKVYPQQIWLTDLSQVTAVLINPHHIDYIRRSGREKSVHSHTDLLCHTFMTVANRICHESQVLCQAEKLSTQDSE